MNYPQAGFPESPSGRMQKGIMVLLPDIRARTDVIWMTCGVWVDGATPQIAALAKRDDVLMVSAA
jgi:hypothetical protein